MKYTKDELCLIWLDSFIGLEYKHKAELFNKINGVNEIKSFIKNNSDYIRNFIGENNYNTLYSAATTEYLQFVLTPLDKNGITAITIKSEYYPEELKNVNIPPLVLYAKGDISLLKTQKFAVVGSRRNLPLSIKLANVFAENLAKAGLTLVTGIAEGVDKAVIESGLKHGKVISVVAGGFNRVYPQSNLGLLEQVFEKGLAISEHPLDVSPQPYFFPVRNRIIAGLGKGSLIVSAGIKSGTMYTANYAVEYGKDLFAVPYSVGISSGEGCNDLIKHGAMLADTPSDILQFYNLNIETKKIQLNEEEKQLIKVLSEGEMHIEKIAKALSKKPFELLSTLSMLEIKGVVVKSGFNSYTLLINNLEE